MTHKNTDSLQRSNRFAQKCTVSYFKRKRINSYKIYPTIYEDIGN